MMRRTILIFTFLALSASISHVIQAKKSLPEKREIELHRHRKDSRPRCPSKQQIRCYYDNTLLYVEFEIPEGNATLSLIDLTGGDISNYYFSTTVPNNIPIGEITTPSKIEIISEYGYMYEGYIL